MLALGEKLMFAFRLAALALVLVVIGAAHGGAQPPGNAPPISPEELIRTFDRDGDGKISRKEAPERMLQRWDHIDTNGDGYITIEELKARDARVGQGGGKPDHPVSGQAGSSARKPRSEAESSPLSVTIVGSGSPQFNRERSGPSALVQCRGHYYLVDMGTGTQSRLHELGVASRQLDALVFTHHHLDHNAEFIPLFLQTLLAGSKTGVIGPPGTEKLVDFARDFYSEDIAYRLRRVGRSADEIGRPTVREIKGGEEIDLENVRIKTARVNHTIHTVAYRFDAEGRSIVISGDLSYTDALIELARGADVLVLDSGGAIVRKGAEGRAGIGKPDGRAAAGATERGVAPHSTGEEVLAMAQKSGPKRLVLTHIAVDEVDEDATIRAFAGNYAGQVIVARDLLEVRADGAAPTQENGDKPGNLAVPVAEKSSPRAAPAGTNGNSRAYVHGGAKGQRADGKTWASAFRTIQEGIDAVQAQGGGEVWVAVGVHKPTTGTDRNATFQLRAGVSVYGGFSGKETDRDQRDWQRQKTVLSGDIGRVNEQADNCYHVVTGADNVILDGFWITGGYGLDAGGPGPQGGPPGGGPPAGGPPRGGPPSRGAIHTTPDAILTNSNRGFGAGMLNFQCAPTVRNCVFQENRAGKGGAVYNMAAKSFPPKPDDQSPMPAFSRCYFLDNQARGRGGAIANDLGTSPVFQECVFLRNSCDDKGGAIYNDFGCSPTLANCVFAENRAVTAGAMGNDGGSSPLIVHCTFAKNQADEEGAAIYQGTGPANNPRVIGSILWGNRCDNGPADFFNWHDNDPTVTGSCIQSGYPGEGNISVDPQFVDPEKGNFRLRPDSPCGEIGYTAATAPELLARSSRTLPFARPRPSSVENTQPRETTGSITVLRVLAGNAAPSPDGLLWKKAFPTLNEAIQAAKSPAEIWVAAGVYKPTQAADRRAAFQLAEGVSVYGGFAGGESDRAQRDWQKHRTVLSGDLGRENDPADNCYHVVIGADAAILDGFTICDGNADGTTYDGKGGGMINYRRGPQAGPMGEAVGFSPVVRNCVFLRNRAHDGGAVYNYDRGNPQFIQCRFEENHADYGGALVDRVGVRSTLKKCEFDQNTAKWRGGAVYLDYGARPIFTQCVFTANRAEICGGAIATASRASQLENTIPLFKECVFTKNSAMKRGGAIANADSSALGLDQCGFSSNTAKTGSILANERRGRIVLLDCRMSNVARHLKDGESACDQSSTISYDRADWPDQSPASAAPKFGPPPR